MDQLDSIYTLVCYIGAGTEFACRAYRRVRRVLYVLGWAPLCSVRARLCQLARTHPPTLCLMRSVGLEWGCKVPPPFPYMDV